jgi:putative heme-binding domain-containing protein
MRYRPHFVALAALLFGLSAAAAADPPSAVGPLLTLLKKGTLPPDRLPAVAKMVAERGNEHDLAYLFTQAAGDAWPAELRRETFTWLREAAATRKVQPAANLSALAAIIAESPDAKLRLEAVRLAAVLKPAEAAPALEALTDDAKASPELVSAATAALISFGGDVARQTIARLLADGQPWQRQARGAAALVSIDPQQAARTAVELLQRAGPQDDLAPLIDAFLTAKGGADRLAAALRDATVPADVALLALRHVYAVGRSDPALDSVLSEQAGIRGEAPRLSEAEILAKADEAKARGDAARGEEVFRRADLACFRCHALSKAGGQIGPDLSSVGVSSPVDYLVKSIYDPDAQKKEEFVTRILLTTDGQQLNGIVARRTDEKITLKTADGKLVEVPAADIEFEAEGKSLMPEGLVKFMTEQEVLDLVKFLSMLGKPQTPYAIRQTQRMQRWRVLKSPPAALVDRVPDEELLSDLILSAPGWEAAYARVGGDLPLAELVARTGSPVLFLQGEVNVTAGGPALLQLDDAAGVTLWLDDQETPLEGEPTIDLTPGRHTLTLRIDTRERRSNDHVRLELQRPSGTSAQFSVVDGA